MYFRKKSSVEEIIKYDDYPYKVYTRVSTDRDAQISSKKNQIDVCRYWIEQNNYEEKNIKIFLHKFCTR
ncbi:hypothetical protein AMR71_03775 [Bacillus altitudinis]|nr:hypothetical protein AKO65_07460 [Bacillus altitudinis]ALM44399.1 hypothetical protein AMR71_03775 [Bacillus altitudinis]ANY95874.1 hypothetical protein AKO66_03775 [Bacillus altitudinis]